VWRLLFSCTVRVIKLSCLLKDLDNLTRSFWFLIAALWRNALSAVSHCMTSTALSECWDRLQKCAHFDSASVQPDVCLCIMQLTIHWVFNKIEKIVDEVLSWDILKRDSFLMLISCILFSHQKLHDIESLLCS
jgi:hypothetical protein